MNEVRHLRGIVDLTDSEIDRVLARADHLVQTGLENRRAFEAATVFLTSSLRTRVGFTVAAQRLGGAVVNVNEYRVDATMSAGETLADTLRTVSGMVDVIVTRLDVRLDDELLASMRCPLVNGGDSVEHPSQALIDASAIQAYAGDIGNLAIGICGDLSMRSVPSLLQLLERRPPRSLSLFSPDSRRGTTLHLPESLAPIATWSPTPDIANLDVLYLPGMPRYRGSDDLPAERRAAYAFDATMARELPASAIVLCPLPMIDEVATDQRSDKRVKMFEQSDRAVQVRMAILELLLGWLP